MPKGSQILQTPRLAAFVFCAALLSGCQQESELAELGPQSCNDYTPINQVQGEGNSSPILGATATVNGIVTRLEEGNGFYLQSREADNNKSTSEGLYARSQSLAEQLEPGNQVSIAGVVSELGDDRNTLTAITEISAFRICESHLPLPETTLDRQALARGVEALEAMNLRIDEELTVTGNYNHARGELDMSVNAQMFSPTEVTGSSSKVREIAAQNRSLSVLAQIPESDQTIYPVGTRVLSGSGVLGHNGFRLSLIMRPGFNALLPRSLPIPKSEPDTVRVVSLNLLNYFNGDGHGGGFPTPRGAKSSREFERQRARHVAAIEQLQPHLLGVMELENDGFGPASAAANLIQDLNSATGQQWRSIDPWGGPIGDDAITVGFFYREDILEPHGEARVLDAAEFRGSARLPLAQTFSVKSTGERFLAVVNHFKSKGGCPDSGRNSDLRDGQGCWNQARTEQARAMASWSQMLADSLAQGRALVMGDLNSYRQEDPIEKMLDAGFRDLTAPSGPYPSFSYVYRGAAGTLDYAFASEELVPLVRTARVLNINSPWPPGMEMPQPWLRSSDHDPIVVDLRLARTSTQD